MSDRLQVNFRVPRHLVDGLRQRLAKDDTGMTLAICQMMKAAIDYIDANGGRWITPALVRAGDEQFRYMAAADARGEYLARPSSSARVADPPAGLRAASTAHRSHHGEVAVRLLARHHTATDQRQIRPVNRPTGK